MKLNILYFSVTALFFFGCTSKIDFEVVPPPPPIVTTELLISEISTAINTDPLAGGLRSHYVEIFNGTGTTKNLSDYAIGYMAVTDNASLITWSFGTNFFLLTGSLLDDSCYVIASPIADRNVIKRDTSWGTTSTLSAQASTPLQLSGNSAIALLKKSPGGTHILNGNPYSILDVFGSPLVARVTFAGTASARNNIMWTIAGETNDTRNRTFWRKATVTTPTNDWATTKGSSPENSQWIISGDRLWDYTNLRKPTP